MTTLLLKRSCYHYLANKRGAWLQAAIGTRRREGNGSREERLRRTAPPICPGGLRFRRPAPILSVFYTPI